MSAFLLAIRRFFTNCPGKWSRFRDIHGVDGVACDICGTWVTLVYGVPLFENIIKGRLVLGLTDQCHRRDAVQEAVVLLTAQKEPTP